VHLARLIVSLVVTAGAPVLVAVDDTLFRRLGKKVWAASWCHDGSAPGPQKVGFGHNWVMVGIVVTLPFINRPGVLAGERPAGGQGHHLGVAAVAGPAHGRRARPRAGRPKGPRRG
jgi:hypothetical protein